MKKILKIISIILIQAFLFQILEGNANSAVLTLTAEDMLSPALNLTVESVKNIFTRSAPGKTQAVDLDAFIREVVGDNSLEDSLSVLSTELIAASAKKDDAWRDLGQRGIESIMKGEIPEGRKSLVSALESGRQSAAECFGEALFKKGLEEYRQNELEKAKILLELSLLFTQKEISGALTKKSIEIRQERIPFILCNYGTLLITIAKESGGQSSADALRQKGLESLKTAYDMTVPGSRVRAIVATDFGTVYLKFENMAQAERYLLEAHDMAFRFSMIQILPLLTFNMGLIYHKKRELAQAEKFFKRAMEYNTHSLQSLLMLVRIYMETQQVDKVIQLLEPRIGRFKDKSFKAEALANLGNAYRLNGDPDKALRCYEQGVVLAKEIGNINLEIELEFISKGKIFLSLKEYRHAIESYVRGLNEALWRLGVIEEGDRRKNTLSSRTLRALQELAKNRKEKNPALLNTVFKTITGAAASYFAAGATGQAQLLFKLALDFVQDEKEISRLYFNLAVIDLSEIEDKKVPPRQERLVISNVLSLLKKAVEKDPGFGEALASMGGIYYERFNNYDKAMEMWERAAAANDSALKVALHNLMVVHFWKFYKEKDEKFLRQAMEEFTQVVKGYGEYGEIYYALFSTVKDKKTIIMIWEYLLEQEQDVVKRFCAAFHIQRDFNKHLWLSVLRDIYKQKDTEKKRNFAENALALLGLLGDEYSFQFIKKKIKWELSQYREKGNKKHINNVIGWMGCLSGFRDNTVIEYLRELAGHELLKKKEKTQEEIREVIEVIEERQEAFVYWKNSLEIELEKRKKDARNLFIFLEDDVFDRCWQEWVDNVWRVDLSAGLEKWDYSYYLSAFEVARYKAVWHLPENLVRAELGRARETGVSSVKELEDRFRKVKTLAVLRMQPNSESLESVFGKELADRVIRWVSEENLSGFQIKAIKVLRILAAEYLQSLGQETEVPDWLVDECFKKAKQEGLKSVKSLLDEYFRNEQEKQPDRQQEPGLEKETEVTGLDEGTDRDIAEIAVPEELTEEEESAEEDNLAEENAIGLEDSEEIAEPDKLGEKIIEVSLGEQLAAIAANYRQWEQDEDWQRLFAQTSFFLSNAEANGYAYLAQEIRVANQRAVGKLEEMLNAPLAVPAVKNAPKTAKSKSVMKEEAAKEVIGEDAGEVEEFHAKPVRKLADWGKDIHELTNRGLVYSSVLFLVTNNSRSPSPLDYNELALLALELAELRLAPRLQQTAVKVICAGLVKGLGQDELIQLAKGLKDFKEEQLRMANEAVNRGLSIEIILRLAQDVRGMEDEQMELIVRALEQGRDPNALEDLMLRLIDDTGVKLLERSI
ncbi:MAG: tetratricopeptide repeat protein [Candidatus Omnitrophica bacterium]|nr:tetratricopeptide repeat protein [Candidatus Omnitrophota bacterium]